MIGESEIAMMMAKHSMRWLSVPVQPTLVGFRLGQFPGLVCVGEFGQRCAADRVVMRYCGAADGDVVCDRRPADRGVPTDRHAADRIPTGSEPTQRQVPHSQSAQ